MGDGLPFRVRERRLPRELNSNQRNEPVRGAVALGFSTSGQSHILRRREAEADLSRRPFTAPRHTPMRRGSWAGHALQGLTQELPQGGTRRELLLRTPFDPRFFEITEIDGQLRRTCAGHGRLLPMCSRRGATVQCKCWRQPYPAQNLQIRETVETADQEQHRLGTGLAAPVHNGGIIDLRYGAV